MVLITGDYSCCILTSMLQNQQAVVQHLADVRTGLAGYSNDAAHCGSQLSPHRSRYLDISVEVAPPLHWAKKNHTRCGFQLLGRRFFLAQLNLRNLAVSPYPQEAQAFFCLWYECLPHLRKRIWVLFWRLPILGVPLLIRTPLLYAARRLTAPL